MNAHTPTPWYTPRLAGNHQGCVASETNGRTVAVTYEGEADAELIVRAVNSHEALVNALSALTAIARTFRNVPKRDQDWGPIDDEVLDNAFAVLAKVEVTP